MSKTLFENSKAALAFAAMTILGAVVMVGSEETGGVLDQTVDRFAQEREAIAEDAREFAESQSVGDAQSHRTSDPDAGWGSSKSVFGDFAPDDRDSEIVPVTGPASRGVIKRVPPDVLLAPPPVMADNEGTLVPRPDGSQVEASLPPPVITSRQMTIEPN